MGKEYIRDVYNQEILTHPNILFHDDFGPLGRNYHNFSINTGVVGNPVAVIQEGPYAGSIYAYNNYAGPNVFMFGSSNLTVGGDLIATVFGATRKRRSTYKLFCRVMFDPYNDDTEFATLRFEIDTFYPDSPGAQRVGDHLWIDIYSNYGAARWVQYLTGNPPNTLIPVATDVLPYPRCGEDYWWELEAVIDFVNMQWKSIRISGDLLDFSEHPEYPAQVHENYAALPHTFPPYFFFNLFLEVTNTNDHFYVFLDEITIEEM